MIFEGFKIMILGMGTVFIMLITLITTTMIASRIIAAYEGAPTDQAGGHPGTHESGNKPLAAIIAAAVAKFRNKGA